MGASLIALGLVCTGLGVGASLLSRFRRPVRSVIPILAGLAPWVVMLGNDYVFSSVILAWICIPANSVLFLVAGVMFLTGGASESEKNASAASWFGFGMSIAWLFPFLSAVSLSHV